METATTITSYIYARYKEEFGQQMDEMKAHKLLYPLQRESLIQTDKPLFAEQFEAWKYGPVLRSVHRIWHSLCISSAQPYKPTAEEESIFDKVFDTYAAKTSWSLSTLTQGEYSWQKARERHTDSECPEIELEDIKTDAQRIKYRRKLLQMLGV